MSLSKRAVDPLRDRMGEVLDVRAAISLLEWDQEVCMPPKGAPARGRQLATLSALAHRLFTSEEMGALIAEVHGERAALEPDEVCLVNETQYDYEHAVRLPASFVEEFAQERSKAYEAWVKARAESDFALFEPNLERIVALLRRKADYLGYEESPYDALAEEFERGTTTAALRGIFGELALKQSKLVQRIQESPAQPDTAWLEQEWDAQAQWDMTMPILRAMGYDFEAGRQDKSVHPFTTNFDRDDVRITTRVDVKDLFSCLTGSMHEGGHALYEQGFREEDRRTVLAEAPSLGIHESQSRLWENMIGRSRPFWEHYVGALCARYPGQLHGVDAEQAYRAINRVRPSLIRVEADECTYNLHIILRFELEVALIEGTLAVADIPEAWNAKVKEYLGLDVPDDARGCLQDIHWSHGCMGYFPTYALGNLYAAQLMTRIEEALPDLWEHVANGDFAPLLAWLREHVHRVGRRKTAREIVHDATGREPSADSFLRYLERKYGELYALS